MPYVLKKDRSLTTTSRQKLNKRERAIISNDPAMKQEIWDEMNREQQDAHDAAYWRKIMCRARWPDGVRENRGGLHYCEGEPRHPAMTDQGLYRCDDCGKQWDPVVPYFEKRSKLTFRQQALAMLIMAKGGFTTKQMADALGVSVPTAYRIWFKLALGPIAPGWDKWTRTNPRYN